MRTQVYKINPNNIEQDIELLKKAGDILASGGLVAFPTETVYGLGANALDEKAVSNIFTAKGRPSDNPLIVHIGQVEDLNPLVQEVPLKAKKLMDDFWPGPLTIILRSSQRVAKTVSAGLSTIALRMPAHPIALALLKEAGVPVAAPSANISGRPSPTTSEHVEEDLLGKIEVVIDGGSAGVGLESTVIDMTTDVPIILRPGGITKEQIEKSIGYIEIDKNLNEEVQKPRSPGMKYKHYAPKAPLYIAQGDEVEMVKKINNAISNYKSKGYRIGVLTNNQHKDLYEDVLIISLGDNSNPSELAANLYQGLRQFDNTKVDIILAEGYREDGVGLALMNRLKKAAGNKYL